MMKAFDRPSLKWLSAASMLADHIGLALGESSAWYIPCRFFGRLACPLVCLFLAEGFLYTKSKKKYGLRLLLFALISQPAYACFKYGSFPGQDLNMLFTLLLSFLILVVLTDPCLMPEFMTRYHLTTPWQLQITVTVLLFAGSFFCDWGIIAPCWVFFFHKYRDDRKKQLISYTLISLADMLWTLIQAGLNPYAIINTNAAISPDAILTSTAILPTLLWSSGWILFVPILHLHSRKKTKTRSLWNLVFYLFYPVHLILITIILNR